MKKYCRSCGKRFDTSELTKPQVLYYGETICKSCWTKRSHFYELDDIGGNLKLYWKEGLS